MAPATLPNQISDWKKQFMDAAPTLFDATHKTKTAIASTEPDVALLYEQIGRLLPGGRGCISNCRLGLVAWGMDIQLLPTMTEEEFLALARQKYQDLQQLKSKPTLYEYEKSFDEICGAARAAGVRPPSAGEKLKQRTC